jgi:hypothetical protein
VRFLRGCRKKCVGGVERKIMVKKMLRSGRLRWKSGSSGGEDILKELRDLGSL